MDIAINSEAKKMNLEKEENAVLGNRLKKLLKNRHFKKIFFNIVKLFTFNFLSLFFPHCTLTWQPTQTTAGLQCM